MTCTQPPATASLAPDLMTITKEVLLADRAAAVSQLTAWQSRIEYIDQQLAFLDRPDPADEKPAAQPRKRSLLCPSSSLPAKS